MPLFTPMLKDTDQRLRLDISAADLATVTRERRVDAFYGAVTALGTGQRYLIYGKECGLPGCQCDAWAVPQDN
jgi:hypothetical protein